MKTIKHIKPLFILLFILSMSITFARPIKENQSSVREYQTKNGVLLAIESNDDLYSEYLKISSKMDRLDIVIENDELDYFIVRDEASNKEMIIVNGAQEVLVLNYNLGSELIPHKLLMSEGQISQVQYESITEVLSSVMDSYYFFQKYKKIFDLNSQRC